VQERCVGNAVNGDPVKPQLFGDLLSKLRYSQ
jgi:hypothetical protein